MAVSRRRAVAGQKSSHSVNKQTHYLGGETYPLTALFTLVSFKVRVSRLK